jgi:hypothetical protein
MFCMTVTLYASKSSRENIKNGRLLGQNDQGAMVHLWRSVAGTN